MLVALAALVPIGLANPQDRTRYELTRHIALHGSIQVEPGLFDRAVHAGRSYSDKAPGMSFLAVPFFELERVVGIAKAPGDWRSEGDASLWLLRVLTSGLLFLLGVAVVGRLAGPLAAAVYGVGTLAMPLAPTFFEHDAAAGLSIAAFALLWRARLPFLAGVCAGVAVCFSYQTAVIAAVLLGYALWRYRSEALLYVLGLVPGAIALGAYDWAAFGSPFRLSYRYVANRYSDEQHGGLFGIGSPSLHGLHDVLVGTRGLLVWSPVCALAAVGLWLMWRRGPRPEALVCAAVTVLFVLADAGYFLPYGGDSPGPRFLAPALPFLILGLREIPKRVVLVVGGISVFLTSVQAMTWSVRGEHDTGWLPGKNDVMASAWSLAGLNRNLGAVLVLVAAFAAVAVAARSEP